MRSITKKGAIELSMTTIVVVVLSMSLLILGIVLIRQIFTGTTGATELINDNVKAQINKLFNDDSTKLVIYLPNNAAKVDKGNTYNLRFAVRNTDRGTGAASNFYYSTNAIEVEQGCQGLNLNTANNYIKLGKEGGPVPIAPGSNPQEIYLTLEIPENAPLCSVSYQINVYKDAKGDSNFYAGGTFSLTIN